VWLLATCGLVLLLRWLLPGLAPVTGFAPALVDLMSALGAVATTWLWLITGLTTLDAARGRAQRDRAGVPTGVRRLVLAACGVAVVASGVALPAHAEDRHDDPAVLAGLPFPDRPTTLSTLGLAFEVAQAAAPRRPAPPPGPERTSSVVVRDGDTLWSIAAARLPRAGNDAIGRACGRLYQLNRAVIGDDPDLIRPGQRLRLPDLTQEDS
jgi:nucleoid-associated protein YgaU